MYEFFFQKRKMEFEENQNSLEEEEPNENNTLCLFEENLQEIKIEPEIRGFLDVMSQIFNMKITKFPGNLPVSLQIPMLSLLLNGYIFTLKADGERCFLSFDAKGIRCIDRKLIQRKLSNQIFGQDWYLFDVEIIYKTGQIFIFDCLIFNNKPVVGFEIGIRFELAKKFLNSIPIKIQILQSKYELPSAFKNYKMNIENNGHMKSLPFTFFNIQTKPFYEFKYLSQVYEDYMNHPSLPIDGFIFYRRNAIYTPFRLDPYTVLKWKDTNACTIDVLVLPADGQLLNIDIHHPLPDNRYIKTSGNVVLSTTPESSTKPFYFSYASFNMDDFKRCLHYIVEVCWNGDNWVPMRIRSDKSVPNTMETISLTIQNIHSPISFSHLKILSNPTPLLLH